MTFEPVNQSDQTLLIWGQQEIELSNLIILINAEKHQTRKKVKNSQYIPSTDEIL
jgi:hypothetical protein